MPLFVKQSSFDAAFARVTKVTLIIEDIVDAINKEVIRNQEEECSDYKSEINFVVDEDICCTKREGGVDPGNRSRGPEQLL